MFANRKSYLFLFVILLLMTGCRGGSKILTQAEGFDFGKMKQFPWAVGGVVINSNFVPDGAAQKELQPLTDHWSSFSEFCSPMLYGGILRTAPNLELWTFETVLSLVPAMEIKGLYKDLERSQLPNPETIRNLQQYLPKLRYLVFARLDDTRLATNQDLNSTVVDQRNRDGRDPHANVLSRTVNLTRGVWMSMEVYDISTGALVFSGEADQWDGDLLSGKSNKQSEEVTLLRGEKIPKSPKFCWMEPCEMALSWWQAWKKPALFCPRKWPKGYWIPRKTDNSNLAQAGRINHLPRRQKKARTPPGPWP